MSHDTTAYEAAVKARITAICPRTYVTEVPDTTATPVYPYVILRWIEPVRTAFDHHMVSSLNDTTRGGLIVTVVSETDASANAVKNRIKGSLAGYRPPDCGEMVLEGGAGYSTSNSEPKPTTYSRDLYLSFLTNLSPNTLVE